MALRLALATLTLGMASVAFAADDPTQRVQFEAGATSATLNGSVTGYRSLRYLLAVRAGQMLSISFQPSKDSLYFSILQGTHTLHDGSRDRDAHDWANAVAVDGDYVIDVYFKTADARRNAQADFALTVTVTNPTTNYRCADGRTVAVMYANDPKAGATIVVAGKSYELPRVASASGARYSAGKVSWWNKGGEGTLELNGPATPCVE